MSKTLKLGMLWARDTKHDLEKCLEEAVRYYEDKYKIKADCCQCAPGTFTDEQKKNITIDVVETSLILPNYYWIGNYDNA